MKCFYARTNKNYKYRKQVAMEVQRQRVLGKISDRNGQSRGPRGKRPLQKPTKNAAARTKTARTSCGKRMQLGFQVSEPLPQTSPKVHFHISEDQRESVKLRDFLDENGDDLACKVRDVVALSPYPLIIVP